MPGPRDGQTHGDRGGVAEAGIVAGDDVLGRVQHRLGRVAAGLESLDPFPPGPGDRHRDEALLVTGQDDVQLDPAPDQLFREQDVGARGQRAVGDADGLAGEEAGDAASDEALVLRDQPADHVPGVVHHRGRRERLDRAWIEAVDLAHQLELAAGRGDGRPIITAVDHGLLERRSGGLHVAEDEGRFRPGGVRVVGVRAGGRGALAASQHGAGEVVGPGGVPRQQPHRGGVDAGVEPLGPPEGALVQPGGDGGVGRALGSAIRQREVLGQPSPQRRDVLLVVAVQTVEPEQLVGPVRGAAAGEGQDRTIAQGHVVRVRLQGPEREIVALQELGMLVGLVDERQPVGRRLDGLRAPRSRGVAGVVPRAHRRAAL